jgi:hypothetical protein
MVFGTWWHKGVELDRVRDGNKRGVRSRCGVLSKKGVGRKDETGYLGRG